MLNRKNQHVVRAAKFAAEIATNNTKPYFGFIESAAFALADKAMTEQKDFYRLLEEARSAKGEPSMLESKKSEAWSCAELGNFTCVKALFANMRELDTLPGLGGLYDIACSIRKRGPFGKGKDLESSAIAWPTDRVDAPKLDKLEQALKLGNKQRNKNKVAQPQTWAEYLNAVIKRLEEYRDGKVTARDSKTGKALKNADGSTRKQTAITSDHLKDAINSLRKVKDAKPALHVVASNGKAVSNAQLKRSMKRMVARG